MGKKYSFALRMTNLLLYLVHKSAKKLLTHNTTINTFFMELIVLRPRVCTNIPTAALHIIYVNRLTVNIEL